MQNHILDPESKYYVQHADKLIKQIHSRLEAARKKNEYILFTRDIPVERKEQDKEGEDLQIIPTLAPKENEKVVKKYYFTMPPESLLEIKQEAFDQDEKESTLKSLVQKRISVSYRIPLLYKAYFQKLIF